MAKKPEEKQPVFELEIGNGENSIKLQAFDDLDTVTNEYKKRLLVARGIPQDINNISPRDPMIAYLSNLPHFKNMPQSTTKERDAKAKLIYAELKAYYEEADNAARFDAMLLAMSTKITLTNTPTEYEPVEKSSLPGIDETEMPEVTHNLSHPVEYRLKQIIDTIDSIPGGREQFLDQMQYISVQIALEAERRNEAKFRTGSPSK